VSETAKSVELNRVFTDKLSVSGQNTAGKKFEQLWGVA